MEDESAELAFCESNHLAFFSLRMAAEARVSGMCVCVCVWGGGGGGVSVCVNGVPHTVCSYLIAHRTS